MDLRVTADQCRKIVEESKVTEPKVTEPKHVKYVFEKQLEKILGLARFRSGISENSCYYNYDYQGDFKEKILKSLECNLQELGFAVTIMKVNGVDRIEISW